MENSFGQKRVELLSDSRNDRSDADFCVRMTKRAWLLPCSCCQLEYVGHSLGKSSFPYRPLNSSAGYFATFFFIFSRISVATSKPISLHRAIA